MPVIAAVRDNRRGKIVQTKVPRYMPGKAPEWAENAYETDQVFNIKMPKANSTNENDLRLHRLSECRIDNLEEVRAEHMGLRKDEIVCVSITEYEKEEFDEDSMEERRRRMREKSSWRQKEECLPIEEEDEYEMDLVDDVALTAPAKPEFVPKKERETLAEREKLEAKKLALEENEERRRDEMKIETKKMLVEEIKKEVETEKLPELISDVDTDDEVDCEEDYKAWVMREVAVIRREKEERDRLRNMTDEERGEWERENPRPRSAPKRKLGFMQRDYHEGVFFQSDGDDIYRRDFSAPTGEDTMNKAILPKVMQVKRFGRSGRTKWTHLVNEDTTDWNCPWAYNDCIREKYNNKMGGMKPIAIRKRSKNLKDRITH